MSRGEYAGRFRSRFATRSLAGGGVPTPVEPGRWSVATSQRKSVKGWRVKPVAQDKKYPDNTAQPNIEIKL